MNCILFHNKIEILLTFSDCQKTCWHNTGETFVKRAKFEKKTRFKIKSYYWFSSYTERFLKT